MYFQDVVEGKPDAVFGLAGTYREDPRPQKVNLMVGIYHDEHLKSELMPTVKKVKEEILPLDQKGDYLPIDGLADLTEHLGILAFGDEAWKDNHARIYRAQTPGGTAALRLGADFLVQEVSKNFYISEPTWPNHRNIFESAGGVVENYHYYSPEKHGLDFKRMCASLNKMREKSVVVLHAACHNPTGCDLTREEWREISKIMKERKLLPFFDFAYQGFGDGLEKDREAVSLFFEDGHEMLISYSCSKNFSLYCQRVGTLFVVNENAQIKHRVGSQIKKIIRSLYSNPPAHGAIVASYILKTPQLKQSWEGDLQMMRQRLVDTRSDFVRMLMHHSKKINFEYLKKHKGMFSYMDLDSMKVHRLMDEFGIYLLDPGRINVAGLTKKNMDYVVESILKVCES